MPQDPSPLVWRKSRRSHQNGECVEIARAPHSMAIRDSKNPDGPMLVVPRNAFLSFAAEIREGRHTRVGHERRGPQ
ncbi:DUF397 domain-containing protein [Actinomadura scrupuli]|uniref:DUF397 domain-containing protein n=1 Tax=Actinomadura scrupuli TaxID=559629 RepID=UPI003D97A603